jgi:ketosteroid isomerase-like protein
LGETDGPLVVLERLVRALNEHDLETLASCFHPEYESEQPAHPERGFRGREKVRQNWAWVFDSFRDFEARLLDHAVRTNTVWTEWCWTGTHPNGRPFEVRGIMILVIEGELIRCGRLYLEPVEQP